MRLRASFFVKIFLGFWLVTLAILATWMLSAEYFASQPHEPRARGAPRGAPHGFILRTVYKLQNLEADSLAAEILRIEQQHELRIFLLDREGRDFSGRQVPRRIIDTADRLVPGRPRITGGKPGSRHIAHWVYRRGEGPWRAVIEFKGRPRHVVALLGANPGLRLALAVVVSGLVCLGLSRLLSGRLRELQVASRRLAEGELDTRLAVRERGGDETDELARDFNSMAAQLQQRIQEQKRLMGDVSHELRSPLARLRIALALAQDDDDRRAQHLARIEQEVTRLEELVAQLLDSQNGNMHFDRHVDVVQLLRQLCDDASFEGAADGKRVVFTSGVETAVVESAGDLLHKTFDNLLRNALAHTPAGSTVTVELAPAGAEVRITVADQGQGVPEEDLPRIFDEFYRVDLSRQRDTGGHGLGLAIARRAVLRHRGRISADNGPVGLRVSVYLPVHSA